MSLDSDGCAVQQQHQRRAGFPGDEGAEGEGGRNGDFSNLSVKLFGKTREPQAVRQKSNMLRPAKWSPIFGAG